MNRDSRFLLASELTAIVRRKVSSLDGKKHREETKNWVLAGSSATRALDLATRWADFVAGSAFVRQQVVVPHSLPVFRPDSSKAPAGGASFLGYPEPSLLAAAVVGSF